MATPYIWVGNKTDYNIKIQHNKKDISNFTIIKPKQIIRMDLETIDRVELLRMKEIGMVECRAVPYIPSKKEEIKYTKYNRFEIMDI